MAGEIVEVVFLGEDVGLGEFFAAGEAPQDNGTFAVRGEGAAAVGIDRVWFTFPTLFGGGSEVLGHNNQEQSR